MTDYCKAEWEHWGGGAIVDCQNKALKNSRYCKDHLKFLTEHERGYASGLSMAIDTIESYLDDTKDAIRTKAARTLRNQMVKIYNKAIDPSEKLKAKFEGKS